jgi:colanic acid/amylovoran biosynthesis protein
MNVLLVDGFCASNRGEAATIDVVHRGLRARLPGASVRAVARFPEVARAMLGLETIADTDAVAVARAVATCDLVVSCGVPLLSDGYPLGLQARLGVLALARRLGKPYVLFGQSLGPFDTPLARSAVRGILDDAAWVLARDPVSAGTVRSLGVRAPVDAGVDVSMLARVAEVPARSGRPSLGVCVRTWGFPGAPDPELATQRYEQAVAWACDAWSSQTGGRVRFIATCTSFGGYAQDDRVAARRVAARMAGPADIRTTIDDGHERVRAELASCDLVISARLHGLIFATDSGVPAVGVAYERRSAAHLESLGLGAFSVPIYAPEALRARVLEAERRRDELRARMTEAAPRLRAQADAQLDRLAAIADDARAHGRRPPPQPAALAIAPPPEDLDARCVDAVASVILSEGGSRVLAVVPPSDPSSLTERLGVQFLRTAVTADAAVLAHGEVRTDGPYDVVCATAVFESCADVRPLLAALRARVTDDGLGVFALRNAVHFWRALAPELAEARDAPQIAQLPDAFALTLASVGLVPERVVAVGAGYLSDDLERDGVRTLPPERALRLARALVFVCRPSTPCADAPDVALLRESDQRIAEVRAALELTRRVPWAARAWLELGYTYLVTSDLPDEARNAFRRAWLCGASDVAVIEAARGTARIDPSDLVFDDPIDAAEVSVLTCAGHVDGWQRLLSELVAAGRLHAAAAAVVLRTRCIVFG